MFERVSWVILAIVHLPPFAAFFMPSLISKLYGISSQDPNFVLLQHRAALFGIVFIACIWAAFRADVRGLSAAITSLSLLSFLIIYFTHGQPVALKTIAIADICVLPCLFYVTYRAIMSGS